VTALIRKIHIYAGLLIFAQLIVYGIAGLVAAVAAGPERSKAPREVEHRSFTPPPSATDKQVAEAVYKTLNLPLTRPMPDWFLQHTPEGHLLLDFYNINGIYRVTVLEDARQLRIEHVRNGTLTFLGDLHAATPGDAEAPALVKCWAAWNEVAMWTLLGFCASGVYLWLSSRPRFTWAWAGLAAGAGSFAYLYARFRL
jgi:hypothetical protein